MGGSQPAGELIHLSKGQRRQTRIGIAECLAHGLKTGNEALILIGADGKKVDGTIPGSKYSVNPDDELVQKSVASIHNHPGSRPCSFADVMYLLFENKHEHMFVIGHNGTLYTMSRTNETKEWLTRWTMKDIWDEHLRLNKHQWRHGPAEDPLQLVYSKAVAGFAEEVGLDYREVQP